MLLGIEILEEKVTRLRTLQEMSVKELKVSEEISERKLRDIKKYDIMIGDIMRAIKVLEE